LDQHIEIGVYDLFLHYEYLVDLEYTDVLVAFVVIGLDQVLFKDVFGLTDDVFCAFSLVLSLLQFLRKGSQLCLKDFTWETLTDSSDFLLKN
jgi:hypothetical protein